MEGCFSLGGLSSSGAGNLSQKPPWATSLVSFVSGWACQLLALVLGLGKIPQSAASLVHQIGFSSGAGRRWTSQEPPSVEWGGVVSCTDQPEGPLARSSGGSVLGPAVFGMSLLSAITLLGEHLPVSTAFVGCWNLTGSLSKFARR